MFHKTSSLFPKVNHGKIALKLLPMDAKIQVLSEYSPTIKHLKLLNVNGKFIFHQLAVEELYFPK